ncbi:alpha/beta hydrolase [Phaeacidiphilus oryzae]|uniref:alpha/beta hydrolase n=1 Tax=Phaeacidiphilus oryzae TaxID=348818 RepID=UPI000566F3A3|nr:alpha/beta hydrolase-fold protein [Phaeacidiphilus oryzae]
MSLTGTPFLILLAVLTVLAVAATLLLWGRMRGPRALRWTARLVLILICQATAICVVAVWINNSYGLYSSWNDLLGNDNGSATAAMPGPPASRAKFTRAQNGVLDTYFRGSHSKLSGQVLVWTPPQYSEPQYRKDDFPVVMLLHGVPGSPQSWLEGGDIPGAVEQMLGQHEIKPFILVMPVIDPGSIDTTCSDTPERRVGSWLSQDVPELVGSQFRVQRQAHAWGLLGLSTGGFCAAKLPLQYPKVFATGAAMSPDPFTGDRSALPDARTRELNSPLYLAKHGRPDVSLFLATSRQDKYSKPANIEALKRAVRAPATVATLILAQGGHNWNTWLRMYPVVFPWLSEHLPNPAPPAVKKTAGRL